MAVTGNSSLGGGVGWNGKKRREAETPGRRARISKPVEPPRGSPAPLAGDPRGGARRPVGDDRYQYRSQLAPAEHCLGVRILGPHVRFRHSAIADRVLEHLHLWPRL